MILVLGGTVIISTLVILIIWKADSDARKKKKGSVPETRSKVVGGDGTGEGRTKDVSSPVKRSKTKAS